MTIWANDRSESWFVAAARNQVRTVIALVGTEASARFARKTFGVVEEVGGLAIVVAGLAALRYFTGSRTHHGMPMVPFLTCGVFIFWTFKTTLSQSSTFASAKARYEFMPRVTQLDVLIARSIVNTLFYVGLALGAFTAFYFIGISDWMEQPFLVIAVLLVSSLLGFGVGMIFGAINTFAPFFRTIQHVLMRVLMFTSGVHFIWPEVPYMFRWIIIENPLFHLCEFIRSGYFVAYESPVASSLYLGVWIASTLAIGLMCERLCRPFYERDRRRATENEDPFALDGL